MKKSELSGEKIRALLEQRFSKKLLIIPLVVVGILVFSDLLVISSLVIISLITPVVIKKLGIKMLGIEFVTLTMVLIALEMGATAGALAGFGLMTAHMIAGQFSGAYLLWVIPSYTAAGFIAGTVDLPLTTLGIGLVAGLNILYTTLTAVMTPEGLPYQIPHALGNIAFNSFLFIYIAPYLVSIL